jgi:chromate transporter
MNLSLQIFWVFFKISLLSFGGLLGALAELERQVVVQHAWVTQEQFLQSFTIGQFVPGPNLAMCPLIGFWVNGWSGFTAAFLGLNAGPILLMAAALAIYNRYRSLEWVRRSELAFRPLFLGLITAVTLRVWWLESAHPTEPILFRLIAFSLSVAGLAFYSKKWIKGTPLIFLVGGLWWIANWALA